MSSLLVNRLDATTMVIITICLVVLSVLYEGEGGLNVTMDMRGQKWVDLGSGRTALSRGASVSFCSESSDYGSTKTINGDTIYCDDNGKTWTVTAPDQYGWGPMGDWSLYWDTCVGEGSDYPACHYCDSMTYAGHSNWILPSVTSLEGLWDSSGTCSDWDPNYGDGYTQGDKEYWSSKEESNDDAVGFTFAGNPLVQPEIISSYKTEEYNVRCMTHQYVSFDAFNIIHGPSDETLYNVNELTVTINVENTGDIDYENIRVTSAYPDILYDRCSIDTIGSLPVGSMDTITCVLDFDDLYSLKDSGKLGWTVTLVAYDTLRGVDDDPMITEPYNVEVVY